MRNKLTKLASLIEEISMGPFGSDIKVENFVSQGVPVLNGSNLTGFKLAEEEFKYVSEEKAKSFKKAIAKRGDIVITHRGTLGQISYIPDNSKYDKYVISQSQFRASLKREMVNPEFLVYYFHTKEGQKRLLANKCHVGVPALAQATTNFKLIEIPLPEISIQNDIASLLTTIDDKISLNNRINAELEQVSQTLYNYWFVQFDFPISADQAASMGKPELEAKPYKTSGGAMVWNEKLKREVPVGWEVGKLSDVANILMGQSPSGESYNESGDGIVFFQGSTDFGYRFPEIRMYTTEPSRIAKEGDILLSVRAPVGTLNVANEKCCIGRGLAALHSKYEANSYLLYLMFYFKAMFDVQNRTGTTFGSIDKDTLHGLQFPMPPVEFQKKFQTIVGEYDRMILVRSRENHELTRLRDFLLPLLMNGQVRVKQ